MDTDFQGKSLMDDNPTEANSLTLQDNNTYTNLLELPINNASDWDVLFQRTQQESFYLNLMIFQHYGAWKKLCDSANVKDNEEESVLNSLKSMIDTIPVGTTYQENSWTCYVDYLYDCKTNGKLQVETFDQILKLAQQKLSVTYFKSVPFWNCVMKHENNGLEPGSELFLKNCLDMYKKQFAVPHVGSNQGIKQFMEFAKEHNIPSSDVQEVVSIYTCQKEEATIVSEEYLSFFQEQYHHIRFEEWISKLLQKSEPPVERAVALCEETVCDEINSICYHFILVKTLSAEPCAQLTDKQRKLYWAIKRGIHHVVYGCDNMLYYFLAFSMTAAAKHLTTSQTLDVIEDVIEKITHKTSELSFFASRKALIVSLNTLVQRQKLLLEQVRPLLVSALVPVTNDCFKENMVIEEDCSLPDYELHCLELKRLSLVCLKALFNTPTKEVLECWDRGFSETKNPLVIYEYITFLREHGTPADVEAAYNKAIKIVEALKETPQFYTYAVRKCLMVLRNGLIKYKGLNGAEVDVQDLLNQISISQPLHSHQYHDEYYLDNYPQPDKKYLMPQIYFGTEFGEYNNNAEKQELRVTEKMQNLSVRQDSGSYPVFLSNLHYKATKKDISTAFRKKGLDVVRIKMKSNPSQQTNYGFAVVELATEEQAKKAVEKLDHMKIHGRPTFVSVCKPKKSGPSTSKPKPVKREAAILFITGIPETWRDISKIRELLECFGHLKRVECNEESGSATVEYQMVEDSILGITKIEAALGPQVKVRRGFARTKKFTYKSPIETASSTEEKRASERGTPGPSEKLSKQGEDGTKTPKPSLFLPLQLRNQMKHKLEINPNKRQMEKVETSQNAVLPDPSPEQLDPPTEKKQKECTGLEGSSCNSS